MDYFLKTIKLYIYIYIYINKSSACRSGKSGTWVWQTYHAHVILNLADCHVHALWTWLAPSPDA